MTIHWEPADEVWTGCGESNGNKVRKTNPYKKKKKYSP